MDIPINSGADAQQQPQGAPTAAKEAAAAQAAAPAADKSATSGQTVAPIAARRPRLEQLDVASRRLES